MTLWVILSVVFISETVLPITAESLAHNRIARGTGLCTTGWTSVGRYCYLIVNATGKTFQDVDTTCYNNNGTLPTFPELQDYTDFYNYWSTLKNASPIRLGYHHKDYVAKYSDIVNYYSQQPMPFASQFCQGEPDRQKNEDCVALGNQGKKCWTDVVCTIDTPVVICQQTKNRTTAMGTVPCGPICRSKSASGHRFSSVYSWICKQDAIVEDTSVAFSLNQYIPVITEYMFLTKSPSGNILNVFGVKGLAAVPTYSVLRYFLVSTVKASSQMIQFSLMINPQRNDTIICNSLAPECINLTAQGWTNQSYFYMFNKMDNYSCNFCVWSEPQNLTSCSATCGNGTVAQILNETCYGGVISNGTFNKFAPCFISPNWTDWQNLTSCNANGTQTIVRYQKCPGSSTVYQNETTSVVCSIASNWTEWQILTPCNASCGSGNETKVRYLRSAGANSTNKNETKIVACYDAPNWTEWQSPTTCDASCGYGNQTQIRFQKCAGTVNKQKNETQSIHCFTRKCKYEMVSCGKLEDQAGTNSTMAASSMEECVDNCSQENWCMGFNYCTSDVIVGNCELLPFNSTTGTFVCAIDWEFYEKF